MLTKYEMEQMERAAFDDTIACTNEECQYEPLEPDYRVCPECGEANTLPI